VLVQGKATAFRARRLLAIWNYWVISVGRALCEQSTRSW